MIAPNRVSREAATDLNAAIAASRLTILFGSFPWADAHGYMLTPHSRLKTAQLQNLPLRVKQRCDRRTRSPSYNQAGANCHHSTSPLNATLRPNSSMEERRFLVGKFCMSVDKSGTRIRRMFGEISARYDFLNHFLSGGTDIYWRWRTVKRVAPTTNAARSTRK